MYVKSTFFIINHEAEVVVVSIQYHSKRIHIYVAWFECWLFFSFIYAYKIHSCCFFNEYGLYMLCVCCAVLYELCKYTINHTTAIGTTHVQHTTQFWFVQQTLAGQWKGNFLRTEHIKEEYALRSTLVQYYTIYWIASSKTTAVLFERTVYQNEKQNNVNNTTWPKRNNVLAIFPVLCIFKQFYINFLSDYLNKSRSKVFFFSEGYSSCNFCFFERNQLVDLIQVFLKSLYKTFFLVCSEKNTKIKLLGFQKWV